MSALCLCTMSYLVKNATCCALLRTFSKIPLFLSFHKFHIMYITMLLNRLRSCFWILLAACSHHSAIEAGSCCGHCTTKFSQASTRSHTAFAKGQSKERWSPFSRGPLHKTQCSWCGQPLFCRLSAVRILSCIRIQACMLHLFSVRAFQMRSCWNFWCEPRNCILYAEWVE